MPSTTNKAKQERGRLILQEAVRRHVPELTRKRSEHNVDRLKQIWKSIIAVVNSEFPHLQPLTVESAKNKFRHYRNPPKEKKQAPCRRGPKRGRRQQKRKISESSSASSSILSQADSFSSKSSQEFHCEQPFNISDVYKTIKNALSDGQMTHSDLGNLIQKFNSLLTNDQPVITNCIQEERDHASSEFFGDAFLGDYDYGSGWSSPDETSSLSIPNESLPQDLEWFHSSEYLQSEQLPSIRDLYQHL